ncbi:hypothetical protein [uncultured Nostoc sp.]|uniref:hypothetical protein n=1 Tax=uncultured Nostoc sp. TaxID=340711 RepID=UPI0035CC198D
MTIYLSDKTEIAHNGKNCNAAELVLTPEPEFWSDRLDMIGFLVYLLWERLQLSAVCTRTDFLYYPLILTVFVTDCLQRIKDKTLVIVNTRFNSVPAHITQPFN